MEGFASHSGLPLDGLTFWVGDEKVCCEDRLSGCTNGACGMVVVSADTQFSADLNALGDALRKRAENEHGSANSFFEAVCPEDQIMTLEIFTRPECKSFGHQFPWWGTTWSQLFRT